MTTRSTLYLVSACGSAEEFVAAFRRYADRTGLFIPSSAPLPAGRRGRLALTLKDGGVMIEGEAEILQSSSKATVLHGRPGMTIKFIDADDLSKVVIAELEKARLAMKPSPPSVPPRPAAVPAEPRPVVPAVGGRIDAANALAECVVIGDPAELIDTAAAKPDAIGKSKFLVPSIPGVGSPRSNSPSTPPPIANPGSGSTRANTPSTPPPLAARPKTPSVPPDPTSRSLPSPAKLPPSTRMTSVGFPIVDKMPAFPPKTNVPGAKPAENPLLQTQHGTAAPANRTVQMAAATPPAVSNQTTLGMPALDRAPAGIDDATTIGEAPSAPLKKRTDPMPVASPARAISVNEEATTIGEAPPTPAKKPTEMPAATPASAARAPSDAGSKSGPVAASKSGPVAAVGASKSGPVAAVADSKSGGVASKSGPIAASKSGSVAAVGSPSGSQPNAAPPPSASKSGSHPAANQSGSMPVPGAVAKSHRATSIGFPAVRTPFETQALGTVRPAAPVVPGDGASAKPSLPQPRGKSATRPPLTPRHPTPVAPVPIVTRAPAKGPAVVDDSLVEDAIVEEEKTDLSGVPQPPSAAAEAQKPSAIDPLATTQLSPQRSGGMRASEILAAIPSDDWTMSPDAAAPTVLPAATKPDAEAPLNVAPTMPPKGPPTGNWSISLDPDVGWSDPVKLEKSAEPAPAPAPAPKKQKARQGTGTAGNPDRMLADEKGFTAVEWEDKPTGIGEAKIEIDSTLMEPLKPMPTFDDDDAASARAAGEGNSGPRGIPPPLSAGVIHRTPAAGMNAYSTPAAGMPAAGPYPTPAAGMPAAGPYPTPAAGMPAAGYVGGYPTSPTSSQYATQAPDPFAAPSPFAAPPAAPAASGLFGNSRATSQPFDPSAQMANAGFADYGNVAAQAATKRKRTILIAAGAIAALVAGFALVLVLSGGKTKPTNDAHVAKTGSGSATVPVVAPPADAAAARVVVEPGSGGSAGETADHPDGSGALAATTVDAGSEVKAPVTDGPCKVSIVSVPNGADIYQADHKLGATPFDLELPCGVEAKVTLRKAKFINTAKSFTPAAGKSNKVTVKLAKTTFTLKVTSTPAGATITVGGKSMGVTPATIRLPAYEASAIMVSKPGYATDSKMVTPKSNNISHHVTLKKGKR